MRGPQEEPEPKVAHRTSPTNIGTALLSTLAAHDLGFLSLPESAPPRLTESIQHGIFKNFVPPLAVYSLLGVVMHLFRERGEAAHTGTDDRRGPGDEGVERR